MMRKYQKLATGLQKIKQYKLLVKNVQANFPNNAINISISELLLTINNIFVMQTSI